MIIAPAVSAAARPDEKGGHLDPKVVAAVSPADRDPIHAGANRANAAPHRSRCRKSRQACVRMIKASSPLRGRSR